MDCHSVRLEAVKAVKRAFNVLCSAFLLGACAADPVSVDDLTGLGNNQVAQALRSSLFLGEEAVNRSVSKLVNTEEILAQDDPRPALRSMGFDCPPLPESNCSYEASATSELSSPDRPHSRRLATFVHIDVMLDSKPSRVVSRIGKEAY